MLLRLMPSSYRQCCRSADLIDNESFLTRDNISVFWWRSLNRGHSDGANVGVGGFIICLGLLLPLAFLNNN